MYSVDTGLLAESRPTYLNFDADGFLFHPENWNHQTARTIAAQNGLQEMTSAHLKMLHYIRDYYFELGGFVSPHRICSELEVDKQIMKRYFVSCLNAWRVAGLPNPGEEAKAYMS
ncbi:MAG: TusE/DsrC/DsvC family sulfur relay protein [Gammaproteobacteria bacterium]|nr:TusE/DsrC/DsvC family sulfur relay protein [Gammaproteobacteria bacterium]